MRRYRLISLCLLNILSSVSGQSFRQYGIKVFYYKGSAFTGPEHIRIEDGTDLRDDSSQSVRFTGYIVPGHSERYTFSVAGGPADEVNDTLRVWVNDKLIIQRTRSDNHTKGSTILSAGIQYALRAENNHGGKIKLLWQSKHQRQGVIPGRSLIPEGAELPPVRVMMNVIGRDPQVTLGPDGIYYMVHTSCYLDGRLAHSYCWDKNDGLRLWKSTDLKNWTDAGLVWSIEKDGTWQKEYDEKGRRPLWAPEIHYIRKMKNWYVVYSMGTFAPQGIRTGLMKSLSGKPEGPYKDVVTGPITEGIDGSLYEENGNVYFFRNHCLMAKMNEDLTGFAEPFRPLKTSAGKDVGFEGSGMLKVGGRYYLYSAKSNTDMERNTYDLNIAVGDDIYGPYSDSWLALRHGGHSSIFMDKAGTIWATLFGSDDLSNVYITPSLVRLAIDTGGRLLPMRGNARARIILPFQGSEDRSIWKYCFSQPSAEWINRTYNDTLWQSGKGGFGKKGNTPWPGGEIWMRKIFNPGHLTMAELENLVLYISHSANIEVYLNGVEACRMLGFNQYSLKKISNEAKRAFRNGRSNVLAVHCRTGDDSPFVDAGLVTWGAY